MTSERDRLIENWTEVDLSALPAAETDTLAYLSPEPDTAALREGLCRAAAAFWNSGGGTLIIGVDPHGQIDGGIPLAVAGRELGPWAGFALADVQPAGLYSVKLIARQGPGSRIAEGCGVLVVAFAESADAPHMAPDGRYYLRAGGRSLPANHYLVEAIRARRGLADPALRAVFRMSAQKAKLIERSHPFSMEIGYFPDPELSRTPFHLALTFHDLAGRDYNERLYITPQQSIGPVQFSSPPVKLTERLIDQLQELARALKSR